MLAGGYRILTTPSGIQYPLFRNRDRSTAECTKQNGLIRTVLPVVDHPVLRGDHCLS
jgi:hypothetical protein